MESEEAITRGSGGEENERDNRDRKKRVDSQLAEFLAELPGVRSNPADGVVAEVELLQSEQAVQPALTHLRQVVVVQLPAEADDHTQTHGETY